MGALCCVGRGFGRAGCAGPGWAQIWLCLARSAGLGVLGALGWVGRGVGRGVWLWWARWAGLIWLCWACWAGLGVGFGFGGRADFARVGRRFGFAWRAQLGVGFGRAGRVGLGWAWGLALGCVGRGIWPCWAHWAGVWLWWARWAGLGAGLAFCVWSTLYMSSSCLHDVFVLIFMCISNGIMGLEQNKAWHS